MTNINWKKEVVIWLSLLAPFIYAFFMWNKIPEQVPTNLDVQGQPEDYREKGIAILVLPAANVVVYFILFFIPRIDPRYHHYKLFGPSYQNIRLLIHVMFAGIFAFLINAILRDDPRGFNFFMAGMALFFALLGNYLRTVRSNWFVGIRTPWTLSNEEVWKRTHALGGKIFFYGGLILAVVCLFVSEIAAGLVLGAGIGLMALIPIVYSYFQYRKITKSSSEQHSA